MMKKAKNLNVIIANFYNYVTEVTEIQNMFPRFIDVYGDGTRWENNLTACLTTYQHIKYILIDNGIIDESRQVKAGAGKY